MTAPLVSILVPTSNRAALLQRSLKSILTQDYKPLEIWIGDNASTDETERLCRGLNETDSRVHYVRRERNIGIYPNHNDLIERSRGEYLTFFHDDDEFDPQLVREEVAFLSKHPEAGIVSPDWRLIDEQGTALGNRRHLVPPVQKGQEYIERTMRSGQSSIGLSGTMIRRSAMGKSRFDENGPVGFGDFVLWFEMAERASVGHIPGELYSYRLHTQSLSRRSILSVTKDYREAISRYFKEHLSRWPDHGPLVRRWQNLTDRYLFWVLAYEISLHFRGTVKPTGPGDRYRTVFELMDYRLSEEEFRQVLTQFRSIRGGAAEGLARGAINFLVHVHWTWPLGHLAPHAPALRGFLGLQ